MIRKQKSLLNLLLVLSVVLIGQLFPLNSAMGTNSPVRTEPREQVKATAYVEVGGIIADVTAMPVVWQGLFRASGEGNIKQLSFDFSNRCTTLFLQNKKAEVHALMFVKRLLFPAHYFW